MKLSLADTPEPTITVTLSTAEALALAEAIRLAGWEISADYEKLEELQKALTILARIGEL